MWFAASPVVFVVNQTNQAILMTLTHGGYAGRMQIVQEEHDASDVAPRMGFIENGRHRTELLLSLYTSLEWHVAASGLRLAIQAHRYLLSGHI